MRQLVTPLITKVQKGIHTSLILSDDWINRSEMVVSDSANMLEIGYSDTSENREMGLPFELHTLFVKVNDVEYPLVTEGRMIGVERICGRVAPILYSNTRRIQSPMTGNPDYPEVALDYQDFIDVITEKISLDNAVERAKERRK